MPLPDENAVRSAARGVVGDMCRSSVTDGEALISSGRIDSLSILKLIARLEARLNITLPPETLQPDDFDSVDVIVDTVLRVARPR